MPKLVRLSGTRTVKILGGIGFIVLRQRGSHVRMVMRHSERSCFVTVPLHPMLDRGTLKSIIRTIAPCVPEETIKELFYI